MSGTKINSSNLVNTSSLLLSSFTGKTEKSKTSLSSSLLGTSEEESTQSFNISKILKTSSIMTQQKNSVSKLAIGVLNAGHTLEAARAGINAGQKILGVLSDLFKQAQDTTLTAAAKQELTTKIQTQTGEYEKLVNETKYNDTAVIAENRTMNVAINQTGKSQKIQLTDIKLTSLGIMSLNASSPEAAKKSANQIAKAQQILSKSAAKLEKSHALIGDTADKFQKILQSILKFEESSNSATSTAESVQTSQLSAAQNSINAAQAVQLLI